MCVFLIFSHWVRATLIYIYIYIYIYVGCIHCFITGTNSYGGFESRKRALRGHPFMTSTRGRVSGSGGPMWTGGSSPMWTSTQKIKIRVHSRYPVLIILMQRSWRLFLPEFRLLAE